MSVTREVAIPAEAVPDVVFALTTQIATAADNLEGYLPGRVEDVSDRTWGADARHAVMRIGRLGMVLDAIDPPGWNDEAGDA